MFSLIVHVLRHPITIAVGVLRQISYELVNVYPCSGSGANTEHCLLPSTSSYHSVISVRCAPEETYEYVISLATS